MDGINVLIAPNAFKNSLTASVAASTIREGLVASDLACRCSCFPIADGGDGTGSEITKRCEGKTEYTTVRDPLGKPIEAPFGLIDGGRTAVIEMADASGLKLLRPNERNPLIATSFGTGQLIKAALDRRVGKIILAMGGSATVDGGVGILQALGVRFQDKSGKNISATPSNLLEVDFVDCSLLDPRLHQCSVVILRDVDNRLLGASGSARVFAPQKGADAEGVYRLEQAMVRWRHLAEVATGTDMNNILGGGAAGGAAAGLTAFLRAELVDGIDFFLDLTGFDCAMAQSHLVITGEGSLDEQTLAGKGPFGVAVRAKRAGIPVIGIAGRIPRQIDGVMRRFFQAIFAIGNGPTDEFTAVSNAEDNLRRTATEIGNLLAITMR